MGGFWKGLTRELPHVISRYPGGQGVLAGDRAFTTQLQGQLTAGIQHSCYGLLLFGSPRGSSGLVRGDVVPLLTIGQKVIETGE